MLEACRTGDPTSVPIDEALGCVVADAGDGHRARSAVRELVEGRLRPTGCGHRR